MAHTRLAARDASCRCNPSAGGSSCRLWLLYRRMLVADMASELDERTSSSDDGSLLVLRLQQAEDRVHTNGSTQCQRDADDVLVIHYTTAFRPLRLAHPRGGSCAWYGTSSRLGVLRTCTMELVEWRRRWSLPRLLWLLWLWPTSLPPQRCRLADWAAAPFAATSAAATSTSQQRATRAVAKLGALPKCRCT